MKRDQNLDAFYSYGKEMQKLSDRNAELEKQYADSKEYAVRNEKRDRNLYRNHLRRTMVEIGQAVENCQIGIKEQAVPEKQAVLRAKAVVAMGFGLNGIREEDKPQFKEQLKKKFGVEGLEDEAALLKRAVASELVLKKLELSEKAVLNGEQQKQLDFLNHLEVKPVDKAISQLLQSEAFQDYYQKALPKIRGMKNYNRAGVSVPTVGQFTQMCENYRQAYVREALTRRPVHPKMSQPQNAAKTP